MLRAVFIGGCDRSGTTLLGAMLGAAPGAVTTPESQFKRHFYPVDGEECPRRAMERVETDRTFQRWGIGGGTGAIASVLNDHPGWQARTLCLLVRAYAAAMEHTEPIETWIDHTPANMAESLRLLTLFPEALFLHIVRDGRAVAASARDNTWGPYSMVDAAGWWCARVASGLALELRCPDRVMQVHYEDLVTEPEPVLRRICDFLGLAYRPEMAAGGRFAVPVYSSRQHRLVGRPPDVSRVRSWERRLSAREIEIFEAHSRGILPLLGYEERYRGKARPASRIEKIRMGEVRLSMKWVYRYLRQQRRWMTERA